jgi:phosphatidylethanolamine/phosphatidyl-N-methylethanolamine N-methyltransferase
VEYGPGTGVINRHLLKPGVLSADSKVIVIELDGPLAGHLQNNLQDPRLHVFHDSADNVQNILETCDEEYADVVISGIPFSKIPKETCAKIAEETRAVLNNEGRFVIYQVTDAVRKHLHGRFHTHSRDRVWLNLPPLVVYRASKNGQH